MQWIKKVINKEQSIISLTYPKEANNWDHSALGTAQPKKMIKATLSTDLYFNLSIICKWFSAPGSNVCWVHMQGQVL